MAGSLIGGLASSMAGSDAHAEVAMMVYEPDSARAHQLEQDFNVRLAASNEQLVAKNDVIVLAVKPQVLRSVLEPLASEFAARKPLIVSIVAGVRAASISSWLQADHAVIRVMPNTPALVSAGAAGLYANEAVTEQHKRLAELLFDAVGISCWVPREEDIDSVTALSGSGPAYFMLFIKSLIDAATAAGLDPHTAKTLALQTARGSVQLIDDGGQPLQTLIDGVTSPKGTTESALKVFQAAGLSHIVSDAFKAARLRAQQLAKDLDPGN